MLIIFKILLLFLFVALDDLNVFQQYHILK